MSGRPSKIIKLRNHPDYLASLAIFQDEARLSVGEKAAVMVTPGGVTITGGQPSKISLQSASVSYAGFAQTTPFPFTLMSSLYSPPQQIPNIPFALFEELPKFAQLLSSMVP